MPLSFTRTEKVLLNQTTAGAGSWVPLDVDHNNTYQALISVSLESGDWVTIQGRLEKSDSAPNFTQATVSAAGATLVPIDGPFNQIRVVKTGTAGNARVVLYG